MKTKQKLMLPVVLCALSTLMDSHPTSANTKIAISDEGAAQQHEIKQLVISQQVKDTIVTMVNAIDNKQWHQATAQFNEDVFVDYSSLTGQQGSHTKATDLVNSWQSLLAKVSTLHQLSNFEIHIDGDNAEAFSHVYASHQAEGIEFWDAYGRYHHKLKKINGHWKITSMALLMHGQKGNLNFLKEVTEMNDKALDQANENAIRKVQFDSEGDQVVGNLYLPKNYDPTKQYPAIIVSGSWTTVKEQMSGLYAQKLANEGFITLAFDPRNFGESGGVKRFYENPSQKIEDIKNAVTFLQRQADVNGDKIGALGICAGSMYTLMAAAEDKRIKSVVTAASWLHDSDAVKLFYGGEEGVQAKIKQAQAAKQTYNESGEMAYIPSISTTDQTAAMYGPYDYYLNPARGAVPEWSADKFAVMSWEDWLTLDPMPAAQKLDTPTLMIHSDGAVLPQYTKKFFENIATEDKHLHWIETELESPYHQFDFYDQKEEVEASIEKAQHWFSMKL